MTAPETTFVVETPTHAREVWRELQARFRTRPGGRTSVRRVYCDTFDWRIHGAGGTLSATRADNGRWGLAWHARDGRLKHRATVAGLPEFAADLDASPLAAELEKVVETRRLFPVVRVETRCETLCVRDRRDKTVARVHLERGTARADGESEAARKMPVRVRVAPVVGYEKARASLAGFLAKYPQLSAHAGGEVELALAAVGRRPGSYSSKLRIELSADLPTVVAARRILATLLDTMRANEDGTREDLDPEFLHDFRVAVRRTRSLLGQVKHVFADEVTKRYRREFAWLGRITGPTRDLDVFLIKIEGYRAGLGGTLARDLGPLVGDLRSAQREEQARLAQELFSARYKRLVRNWSRFLGRESAGSGPANASRPVGDVAAERIRRIYKRVRKTGRGLDAASPPEAVHRLRIDCKKLRYLLEFFRSLYDDKQVARFVRSLKRLQDYLGDHNDFEVQQNRLREMADGIRGDRAPTLLAMGELVRWIAQRQAELKAPLLAEVRRFVNRRNRAKLDEMLG